MIKDDIDDFHERNGKTVNKLKFDMDPSAFLTLNEF